MQRIKGCVPGDVTLGLVNLLEENRLHKINHTFVERRRRFAHNVVVEQFRSFTGNQIIVCRWYDEPGI